MSKRTAPLNLLSITAGLIILTLSGCSGATETTGASMTGQSTSEGGGESDTTSPATSTGTVTDSTTSTGGGDSSSTTGSTTTGGGDGSTTAMATDGTSGGSDSSTTAMATDGTTEGTSTSGTTGGCEVMPGHCNPLDTATCVDGQICVITGGDGFICSVDASGRTGAFGDACVGANTCDPGLFCAVAGVVPGCKGDHCCALFCDLTAPDCPQGTECAAFYLEGQAPECLENLGGCGAL